MWHEWPEDRCFQEEPVLQSHELHWPGPRTGRGTFSSSLPTLSCFINIASVPASSLNTGQAVSNYIELPSNENCRGCCGHLTSHQWHASPQWGQPFPHESNLDTLVRFRMHRKPHTHLETSRHTTATKLIWCRDLWNQAQSGTRGCQMG